VVWCLDLQGTWAFLLYSIAPICFTLSRLHILVCFPLYSCISPAKYHSTKYMWNFVNSNDICV
jgi:hypothetical protein